MSSSRNKKGLQSQNDQREIEIPNQNTVRDQHEAIDQLQKSFKKIEEEIKIQYDSYIGDDQNTEFLQKMNDKNLIYLGDDRKQIDNNDIELPYNNGCCCFSVSKRKSQTKNTSTQKIPTIYESIPDLYQIISKCNFPIQQSITDSYQDQSFNSQSHKTFEIEKFEKSINVSIQSLRSDEQNINKLNLHDLAIKILSNTSKSQDYIEYQINNKFIEISKALIFNKSFLSMPIKYKSNIYILCGQINPDEYSLSRLQKQFSDEYEDNNSHQYLLSAPIERNKILKFFIAKVNKKKNSKIITN